eukprot:scaffold34893_cov19-Tisochrysis_lutea.AAC.1
MCRKRGVRELSLPLLPVLAMCLRWALLVAKLDPPVWGVDQVCIERGSVCRVLITAVTVATLTALSWITCVPFSGWEPGDSYLT